MRRALVIDAVGTSCENNALGIDLLDCLDIRRVRKYLAVDLVLAHPARDQLVILTAEIKYYDLFHYCSP